MLIKLENEFFQGMADSCGGELISLLDKDGVEYLWGGEETYWVGRSPHLFPIIGALKNQETLINGRKYSIGKHGFARNALYEVAEKTNNSVTFLLKDTEETREKYPFSFSFYVTHALQEKGFITSYRIVNESKQSMPFCVGGHPGVRCPIGKGEAFAEYEIVFEQPVSLKAYFPSDDNPIRKESEVPFLDNTDRFPLSYDLFAEGPVILDRIPVHALKLVNQRTGRGVSFVYEGFPALALWTFGKKHAPYLCLEPWHGLPAFEEDGKELSEKPYAIDLKPGEEKRFSYCLQVL